MDIVKPKSSRSSSVEAFVVCQFFDPPKDYKLKHFSALEMEHVDKEDKDHYDIAKFIISGDMSCYDEWGVYLLYTKQCNNSSFEYYEMKLRIY